MDPALLLSASNLWLEIRVLSMERFDMSGDTPLGNVLAVDFEDDKSRRGINGMLEEVRVLGTRGLDPAWIGCSCGRGCRCC